MRILLLACFTLLLSCAHEDRSGQNPWANFLGAPSPENESQLMKSIKADLERCDWGKVENRSAVPDKVRQELFALIASGDNSSLRVGVNIEKCLDGGDLGDFRRSAGLFLDRRPNDFIDETLKLGISPERFSALITRLPLELVDNPSGQAKLVEARKIKLEVSITLANTDFLEHGVDALNSIQKSLSNTKERD